MGAFLPLTEPFMPEIYSFKEYQQAVQIINEISKQICRETDIDLNVREDTLFFCFQNWKFSTCKAILGLVPSEEREMRECVEGERQQRFSYLEQIQLTLNLRQIYQVCDLVKKFKKSSGLLSQSQRTVEASMQTPTFCELQERACEICFDEQPDMALPCGHPFCAKCISKYIIEREEKKCPKCRHEFKVGRTTLQRNLYTIIDFEGKFIYQELRKQILQILKEGNQQNVKKAQVTLKEYDQSA